MPKNPLLLKGFTSGWLQKFFNEPFDPLCIMLAMRSRLLLDAIDEMGKSYNLLRSISYGWVDLGEVPGEEPGNPADYYPPGLEAPIIITPPAPGEPGYVPPTPGEPGYVPPGPGEPGYVPPGPGEPGYIPPAPGEPGYVPPGPGEPGYVPPGGVGAIPGYGGGGVGGTTGAMAPPWGLSPTPGDLGGRAGGGAGYGGWNCCLDKDDPESYVHIGYVTLEMNCGDSQGLTVAGYKDGCLSADYTWAITQGSGSLDTSVEFMATYAAPAGGEACESPVAINLYCFGDLRSTIIITLNACPAAAHIDYADQQMLIDEEQTLSAGIDTPGCGTPVFDWAITAGGGTLSVSQGASTIYQAPHTNAECANNPTIELSCNGTLLDTLQIAVNASASYGVAALECITHTCPPCPTSSGYCGCCRRTFRCWGAPIPNGSTTMCTCKWPYQGKENWYAGTCAANGYIDGFNDRRTPQLKTGGCCPAQLL